MVIEYLPKKVNKYSDMFRTIKNMTLDVMQKNEGVSIRARGITFIDKLPTEILNSFHGYLFYDVEDELFVGSTGVWAPHVRDILTKKDVDDFYDSPHLRDQLFPNWNSGNELLFVPCESFESWVSGDLFVYQEFDWMCAFVIKSNSGKLRMETGWIPDL